MNYTQGERVTWQGLNRTYTGVVDAFRGPWALVRIDGSAGYVLLQNEPLTKKEDGNQFP